MNEWMKKIRSSVQSVVESRRRKSSAIYNGDAKRESAPARLPEPVVEELPQPEPPQLSSLTKQRARGPARRRPPSRQLPPSDTTVVPAAEEDPARFAWGRDPSIDPALFFSDVLARSMPGNRTNGMVGGTSGSLASIVEEGGDVVPEDGEFDGGNAGDTSGTSLKKEGSSEASSDSNRGSQGDTKGDGENESENRESAASSESRQEDAAGSGASDVSAESDDQSSPAEAVVSDAAAAGSGDAVVEADASEPEERRQSGVLRLTGGKVEGAPRRLCVLL